MKLHSLFTTVLVAVMIDIALPAVAQETGEKVTPNFNQSITNIPGRHEEEQLKLG